jgi:effector-binding domain-containing protein
MQRNDRSYKDLKQKQKSAIADKTYKMHLKFYLENQRMPDATEMNDICKSLFTAVQSLAPKTEYEEFYKFKQIEDEIFNLYVEEDEGEQIRKVKDLREGLNEHLKKLKVRIYGEGTSKPVYVAYIQLKSVLQEKAQTMIGNDAAITGFLYTHKIKIVDRPYVEIVDWDLDKETIVFNYCFPIDPSTKAIADANVKFKTIPSLKGIKATYYGNFRTSDRAWFALMDYAKKNDLKIKNIALEHFLANPFNGGNELEWETQIIMPYASE